MTVGPIIADVTDMSQPSAMAIQMEEARYTYLHVLNKKKIL